MSLPRPTLYCPICGTKISGRADKIFCSTSCKSRYHLLRKDQHLPYSHPIDKILHRNWVLLSELHERAGKRKFYVSKAELNKAGFHTKYYTTSQTNKQGKTYYYVYNYGWMDFSESDLMIVRLAKSK